MYCPRNNYFQRHTVRWILFVYPAIRPWQNEIHTSNWLQCISRATRNKGVVPCAIKWNNCCNKIRNSFILLHMKPSYNADVAYSLSTEIFLFCTRIEVHIIRKKLFQILATFSMKRCFWVNSTLKRYHIVKNFSKLTIKSISGIFFWILNKKIISGATFIVCNVPVQCCEIFVYIFVSLV